MARLKIRVKFRKQLWFFRILASNYKVKIRDAYRMYEKIGRPFELPDDFFSARTQRQITESLFVMPKQKNVVDRSPGWWERENLSNAGENGFSKAAEQSSFSGWSSSKDPCYTGKQ